MFKRHGPFDHMKPRDMERFALHFVMHQMRVTGIGAKSVRNDILAATNAMGLNRDDFMFFVVSLSKDFIREVENRHFDKELEAVHPESERPSLLEMC